jgi:hypothetical protein
MIQTRDPQQQARINLQSIKSPSLDTEHQADTLLARAQEAQAEQTAIFEATPLESQYSAAFAALVEAKRDQAQGIEDRLENLIEQQASRLQCAQANQPGFFSLPGTQAKWQAQLQQQQSVMLRLHTRLENVREIKNGMGVHAPRIEELATRKLRAERPDLAEAWDEMREAARCHQALMRKKEQERRQQIEGEHGKRPGRSLSLELSQTP